MKDYFIIQGCELLSTEYNNTGTKLKYKCICKNISNITFNHFQKGTRCRKCQKQKTIDTCLERYGYEHPMQVSDILDKQIKSAKSYKDYILPSGKIVKLQGYEHLAFDILLKIYNENKILSDKKDIPKIYYQLNNKNKIYFPDIFIKSENIIIEVKSYWTYKQNLIKNIHKALATRKLGYLFEIWIFDTKGNLNII